MSVREFYAILHELPGKICCIPGSYAARTILKRMIFALSSGANKWLILSFWGGGPKRRNAFNRTRDDATVNTSLSHSF